MYLADYSTITINNYGLKNNNIILSLITLIQKNFISNHGVLNNNS